VTEVLSRYLAITAPDRSRAQAEHRRASRAQVASANDFALTRAEELWDSLGDFA
jgi:hypothetical protein